MYTVTRLPSSFGTAMISTGWQYLCLCHGKNNVLKRLFIFTTRFRDTMWCDFLGNVSEDSLETKGNWPKLNFIQKRRFLMAIWMFLMFMHIMLAQWHGRDVSPHAEMKGEHRWLCNSVNNTAEYMQRQMGSFTGQKKAFYRDVCVCIMLSKISHFYFQCTNLKSQN